ncbi:ABC transporter permease [Ectothiorhodospira mobilis]|uniref:ABC transporter permease n=1 Tax=Ectothiorhodospira mobilis TaxID=195064 RepID=UPI001903C559|nr:ABC transporter permease [Ectothiorhodospira mobilis]MBK1691507.1 ABC transporter permease [Ectothiorhodospira mobilis]
MTEPLPSGGIPRPPAERRSYAAQVAREVLARWGARLGLAWIGLLVLVAVFAPFLASSHPWLVVQEGRLSSPVLAHLGAADLALLAGFAAAVVMAFVRHTWSRRLAVVLAALLLGGGGGALFLSPPDLVIHAQYREAEARGAYDWVLRAPVPYSPKDYLRDRGDTGLQPPLADPAHPHWLGTDVNGADVLSRMIHATRIALGIGFVATGIALAIGVVVGGLMGYFSGVVDMIGMRIVEIFEAIPTLFLLLTFVAFFGRNLYMMMVIIGLTSWSGYARYVRAEFLKLRQQDYVQAAVACGLPLRSILFRHMLPNGVAPILVAASFGVASAILAEATLSFLGLGLVDDPSWGQMLNQAVQSSTFNWWMALFPGGAIFLTVFAYNLVGESLRDALDPYLDRKA